MNQNQIARRVIDLINAGLPIQKAVATVIAPQVEELSNRITRLTRARMAKEQRKATKPPSKAQIARERFLTENAERLGFLRAQPDDALLASPPISKTVMQAIHFDYIEPLRPRTYGDARKLPINDVRGARGVGLKGFIELEAIGLRDIPPDNTARFDYLSAQPDEAELSSAPISGYTMHALKLVLDGKPGTFGNARKLPLPCTLNVLGNKMVEMVEMTKELQAIGLREGPPYDVP